MSLDNVQILKLAQQGLSAAEIAESLTLDVEAVAFVLRADGEIARKIDKAAVNKLEAEFMAMEDLVLNTMKEIIIDPEVKASTRADLCKYVVDQRLGLKTPKTTVNVFNINDFNDKIKAIKERRAEIEALDVESTKLIAA